MRLAFIAGLALFFAASARADFNSAAVGTTAAQFLELGVGARGEAMGEAYSSVVDGADALYWNPAALTYVQDHEVTLMDAPYIDGTYYDSVEYAQKAGPGGLGVGLQYFNAGTIPETDASGAGIGDYTPHDLAVSVGYGYAIHTDCVCLDGLSLGGSVKYIQSNVLVNAQTAAVDLGALSPGYLDNKLRLALTATNIGGTLRYDTANENLPMAFRAGGSYEILPGWLGSADVVFPRGDGPALNLGTEYACDCTGIATALRAGYNTRTTDSIPGFTGASFGLGLTYRKLSFDYALLPFGDLGLTQRVSLSARF